MKKQSPGGARRGKIEKTERQRYFSRAVSKALDAIELLSRSSEPLPLNRVASHLKLTKASALRILGTLQYRGVIERDANGNYSAVGASRTGMSPAELKRIQEAAEQPMSELHLEFRETVSLAALFENHIEVIAVFESPELIRMGNTVGRILPPHASSLGKAIAAFQEDAVRDNLVRSYGLQAFTENTIIDERALRAEYESIRSQGYSLDREETVPGGCCFGAPITDGSGRVVAAMSISLPKPRLESRGGEKIVLRSLRDSAARVSAALKRA
jgi:IclR family acetate operon transcriptional repressor